MQELARGLELARALLEQVHQEMAAGREFGRRPCLGIVAGDDAAARKFVALKEKQLEPIGVAILPVWLSAHATTDAARRAVAELNARDDVDAIFVQFPLPADIDADAVANDVAAGKDIDCSSATSEAAFHRGESSFTPVAPHAALDLLRDQLSELSGRHIGVFGGDDPFTRVLRTLLLRAGAHVSVLDPAADAPASIDCRSIVVGEATPRRDWWDALPPVQVPLDAAYYLPPRAAGWLPDDAGRGPAVHLTQYGNVGPLTVAHLAAATVQAACK